MSATPDAADTVGISYGRGRIPLRLDPGLAEWHVLRPRPEPPLAEARAALVAACRQPLESAPLRQVVRPSDRVVLVTADGTRPVPNHLLVPWILAELPVPPEQVTVLLGTGSHRPNTPAEIRRLFGDDLAARLTILNHDAYDPAANVPVDRRCADGTPARLDRRYVEADRRIAIGFIEPHFFAGYSGGGKAVAPGVASIDTIRSLHRADLIGHPRSTWLTLEDNPIRHEVDAIVGACPPDFLVNVTLDTRKEITGVFAGHWRSAHAAGCRRVRESAAAPLPCRCPLVVTSNSGFPLDQNLYQAVKGMSAAALAVAEGGTILVASECSDGIPAGGEFARIMALGSSARDVLDWVYAQPQTVLDQWQAQVLAGVLLRAQVGLLSSLAPEAVRACRLAPVGDLQGAVEAHLRRLGGRPPVAVLPDGPLTVPCPAA